MNVVVVGAGISGLSAAWTLQQAGVEPVVMEASPEPGGRMRSLELEGTVLELGAQFLSSAYSVVPELAAACGLDLAAVSPGGAILRDGRLRPFRSDRPTTFLTGGVLPWSSVLEAGRGAARLRSAVRGRRTHDLTTFAGLDDVGAAEWAHRVLGRGVAERFLPAVLNGFYFQSLGASGAPLAAAVAAFGDAGATTTTIEGGLGRLPCALAERLDVRYGHRVTGVAADGGRVRVEVGGRAVETVDRLVLAVPAPAARRVHRGGSPVERELLSTTYSSGLLIGVTFGRALPPSSLAGAYGVLVHPGEATDVAAVAVASRAHPGRRAGDVVTVMTTDRAARAWADDPDELVGARALSFLRECDPHLPEPTGTHVVRWPAAMPTVPVGHARLVDRYRRSIGTGAAIVLAGDYLGFPWTDSAAATGRWAARTLLREAGRTPA